MIKDFFRTTLTVIITNISTLLIYYVSLLLGIIHYYELAEDYIDNYHIFVFYFCCSLLIFFALSLFFKFNKSNYIILVIELLVLAALAEIFDFFLLNINYSGLVVIFQHIFYKSQSLTEINTVLKIVSAILSTFSLSIIGWSANLIRSRTVKRQRIS